MLVLNNLFLNVDVMPAFLLLNVATCDIARKNVAEFPLNLIKIKTYNRLYLWDSCVARIIENVLCFI